MLLPDHSPEIPESLGERALGGNVGVLPAVAIDVVGVDVVATRDTCVTEGTRVNHDGCRKKGLEKDEEGKQRVESNHNIISAPICSQVWNDSGQMKTSTVRPRR